jgi:hypothetical protein
MLLSLPLKPQLRLPEVHHLCPSLAQDRRQHLSELSACICTSPPARFFVLAPCSATSTTMHSTTISTRLVTCSSCLIFKKLFTQPTSPRKFCTTVLSSNLGCVRSGWASSRKRRRHCPTRQGATRSRSPSTALPDTHARARAC